MARYDRIARLEPPHREDAFTGWLALRDLEGQERDPDLGRRARLRFLALRPVHRLVRHGDEIDVDSLRRQCDAAREELGQLPGRDPERKLLAELLNRAATPDPGPIVRAALELGDRVRADGHPFAAEGFYRAGLALAEAHGLEPLRAAALDALARLEGLRGPAADGSR